MGREGLRGGQVGKQVTEIVDAVEDCVGGELELVRVTAGADFGPGDRGGQIS
jgi:hypothetical protein